MRYVNSNPEKKEKICVYSLDPGRKLKSVQKAS